MPFKSEAQRRFLYATNPEVAEKFSKHTKKGKKLPERVKKMEKKAGTATKTDPKKWEQAKADAKARMGGKHSARAMQLATQLYKKRGGGYSGAKPTAKNNSLKKWGKQKWKWSGGEKKKAAAVEQGGRGVYLPEDKIKRLKSSKEGKKKLRAAERKKAKANREGRQYSSHGLAAGTSLRSKGKKKEAKLLLIEKLAFSSPALGLISELGPGAVLGYQLGREASRQTAASVAPRGRKTRSESIANKLGIPATVLGALGGMYLTKGRAVQSRAKQLLASRLSKLSPKELDTVVQLGLPVLSGIGGGTAAGAATGLTVGGIARLRGKK